MPEAKMPLRYERRKDTGRNGSAGTISILYKTVSYTEKEGDQMYNENEDVLILASGRGFWRMRGWIPGNLIFKMPVQEFATWRRLSYNTGKRALPPVYLEEKYRHAFSDH